VKKSFNDLLHYPNGTPQGLLDFSNINLLNPHPVCRAFEENCLVREGERLRVDLVKTLRDVV